MKISCDPKESRYLTAKTRQFCRKHCCHQHSSLSATVLAEVIFFFNMTRAGTAQRPNRRDTVALAPVMRRVNRRVLLHEPGSHRVPTALQPLVFVRCRDLADADQIGRGAQIWHVGAAPPHLCHIVICAAHRVIEARAHQL